MSNMNKLSIVLNDRRRPEAIKLREYIGAIKQAKEISNDQWVAMFIAGDKDAPWLPRESWIAHLEECALAEASKLVEGEAV